MRPSLTLAVLTLTVLPACFDVNAKQCTPQCDVSQLCCAEPNHNFGDGGSGSEWECVTPTAQHTCPVLP